LTFDDLERQYLQPELYKLYKRVFPSDSWVFLLH